MNSFYIVATPIGNIKEISERAIDVFKKTEIFFCEDTRVTKKLLELLNIDYSNKKFVINNLITENDLDINENVFKNKICCLVSDAGYPLISDPGYNLVSKLMKLNIKIEVVNGPSAFVHALIASGLPINKFYFAGFLSSKKSEKISELHELKKIKTTIILYEGSNKILSTLDDIEQVLNDPEISVCKELTKINEKIYSGRVSEIKSQIDTRGEFVIVINNNNSLIKLTDEDIINESMKLIKKGLDKKTVSKMISYKYDMKSNIIYDLLLKNK